MPVIHKRARSRSRPATATAGRSCKPPAGWASAACERSASVRGRARLDHEWSDEVLPPLVVGWDWIGFPLDDGSALTAFRLRRPEGRTLWAGAVFARRMWPPERLQHLPPTR